MSSSVRDVAKRARVSTGTVSNVFNRPEIVSAETLIRVRRAIEELNFVPNGIARQLRSGLSRTIGLIVPEITNPFYMEVSRGVEEAASKHDYSVFLCNSDGRTLKEDNYIKALLEQRVRGIVFQPTEDGRNGLELLKSHHVGVTLLDHKSSNAQQCSVYVDHVRGGEIAIQHLSDLGHRRIAWIAGSDGYRQCVDRASGAQNIAKNSQVDLVIIELKDLNSSNGEEAAQKVLELDVPVTAIFCLNDHLAIGVMRELIRRGVRVPQDISLIGYDDISFAPSATVPLSSIAQPAYELGFTAAELLISECDDPLNHVHQSVVFEPTLVARSSTSVAPSPSRTKVLAGKSA